MSKWYLDGMEKQWRSASRCLIHLMRLNEKNTFFCQFIWYFQKNVVNLQPERFDTTNKNYKVMKKISYFILAAVTVVLAACGDGNDPEKPDLTSLLSVRTTLLLLHLHLTS